MSEKCKEHRPLLCDDLDEDPFQSTPYQRRHTGYRGRARNNIKGAAAIIRNWPDHWTGALSYWFVGFGMIAITVCIIYNSILYASVPTAYSKLIKQQPTLATIKDSKILPEVFMHVVVNSEKEADFGKYLPYVEIFANRHFPYKFNLVLLFNDTTKIEELNYQDKLNNDEAMNSLWMANNINDLVTTPREKFNNVITKRMTLSSYMNASPLRDYWKQIPHQFIEFLVRAVSVWEKGGIALNPIILTPRSPHPIYLEKLHKLLRTYQVPKLNKIQSVDHNLQNNMQKKPWNGRKRKTLKRVNNIRDIIDAMDSENSSQSEPAIALNEAESRQILTKIKMKPYLNNWFIISKEHNANFTGNIKDQADLEHETQTNPITVNDENDRRNNATEKLNFLPSLFDLLFRVKPMNEFTTRHATKRSSIYIPAEITSNEMETNHIIEPMIIPAPRIFDKFVKTDMKDNVSRSDEYEDNLTIDLIGNLLSTRISCHAFIGSVFNNAKHCSEDESLKDFIISQLSQFCKGLLSTCKGIDVILV